MKGGHFLLQHVDLEYGGRKIRGLEVIGHEYPLEGRPSKEIESRFYDASTGLTLDYVYELAGDVLKIWFGPRGSNNRYLGKFSPDGNSFSGAWKWPGGGYKATMTRVG